MSSTATLRTGALARAGLVFSLARLVIGCGDPPTPSDAGDDTGIVLCTSNASCSDGRFCNGLERCAPTESGADAMGCVAGSAPCASGRVCDEAAQSCSVDCATASDADGDGVVAVACGGMDCDDTDPNAFAGNPEVCDVDGHDEDCDPTTYGARDLDLDGVDDGRCCNALGTADQHCGDDCDDARRTVSPTSPEVCDHLDDDCDGAIDESVGVSGFVDADADGAGDPSMPVTGCFGDRGFVDAAGDCDDSNPQVRPGLGEACDGIDNDCDPSTTDSGNAGPQPWFRDGDGDGYGDGLAAPVVSCAMPGATSGGYSLVAGDCADADPNVSPVAAERCNARDDDCDGYANFFVGPSDLEDDDGDGAADAACGGDDCDDRDWRTRPHAPEIMDGRDNDCDGMIDEASDPTIWYADADDDGYGDDATTMVSVTPIGGYVQRGGDCVPFDATIHPQATEICDGVDQNCDGHADEGLLIQLYPDADLDGYGDAHRSPVTSCTPVPGLVHDASDCDDANARVNPGAPDVCGDAIDSNCDGRIDDLSCIASPVLAFLTTSAGHLEPAFTRARTSYVLHLPFTAPSVRVTPFCSGGPTSPCAVIDSANVADGAAAAYWRGDVGASHTVVGPDGTSYAITIARDTCHLEYVQAPAPSAGAAFGSSLGAFGHDLVVGAAGEATSGGVTGAGAAYVFSVPFGGGTRAIGRFVPAVQDTSDLFGFSSAICGDDLYVSAIGDDAALGAPLDDNSATDLGTIHHYHRAGGRWQWADALRPSAGGRSFGWGLACDRQSGTIVGTSQGLMDVFNPHDTSAPIATQTGSSGALFGRSAAITGDRIVVGEIWTGNNEGTSHVYLRTPGTSAYTQLQLLSPFGIGPWDNYGSVVVADGTTIAIGSNEESQLAGVYGASYPGAGSPQPACASNPEKDYGAVYVYERGGSSYALAHWIKSPTPYCKDYFGLSLSLSGDLLLVGARGESTEGTGVSLTPRPNGTTGVANAGGAYLYSRSEGTWMLVAHLEADVRDADDHAGTAVTLGDHFLAFSAPQDDSGVHGDPSDGSATDAGGVWVCSWPR